MFNIRFPFAHSAPTLGLSFGTPATAATPAAATITTTQNAAPAFSGFGTSVATTSPWAGGGFCLTTTTTTATISNR